MNEHDTPRVAPSVNRRTRQRRPKLRIGITGLDARENAYPGLALARALKEAYGPRAVTVALTYNIECTGIYCRSAIDEIRLSPYPSDQEDIWLKFYRGLQSIAPIDVLFPALDTEIPVHARIADELRKIGIRTLLPSERVVKARGKLALLHTCQRLGIPTPRTVALNDLGQLDILFESFSYPVYLKASVVDARKASNVDEARFHYLQLLERWGYPILVQQGIAGEEYDVVALADRDSELVGAMPIKKFGITARGKAFSGVALDAPDLLEQAADMLRKLRWVGPCELELMKEASTGIYHVLEINARFPAWAYFTAPAGMNLIATALELALDEEPGSLAPYRRDGIYFRNVMTEIEPLGRFARLMTGQSWPEGEV